MRVNLKWTPPKPLIHEGIKDISELFRNQLASTLFRDGFAGSFVKTGTMHDDGVKFVSYEPIQRVGTAPIAS